MTENHEYSINNDGYFGVTFLELECYGAYLLSNTIRSAEERGSVLHFDETRSWYHDRSKALTIEGMATKMSTPGFAIRCLEEYVKVARQMDELYKPFAS